MLKNIFLAIMLVMLFSVCVFAQAKPLDPAKDYAIGPFKPGDAWNLQLAEKYFGKLVATGKTRVDLSDIVMGKNGLAAEPVDVDPAIVDVECMDFKEASFIVSGGKIVLISTTAADVETVRGIRVGDSLEKLKNVYPANSGIVLDTGFFSTAFIGAPITDLHNIDGESPEFCVCFKAQDGTLERKIFIFVDKKTRTVAGLAFHSSPYVKIIGANAEPAKTCRGCGQPLKNNEYYVARDNKKYCESCHIKKQPKMSCSTCQVTLGPGQKYYYKDEDIWCDVCYTSLERCKGCGKPIAAGTVQQDPDYKLCKKCNSVAINDFDTLIPIWKWAKKSMETNLGFAVDFDENNFLLETLASILKKGDDGRIGLCLPLQIGHNKYTCQILLQKGLTAEEMFSTLCHEYAHAWSLQQNFEITGKQDEIFREGFAEWVAYKCNVAEGYSNYADRRLRNPDPVYGEGLRKMLALEKKLGSSKKILEYVVSNTGFPN